MRALCRKLVVESSDEWFERRPFKLQTEGGDAPFKQLLVARQVSLRTCQRNGFLLDKIHTVGVYYESNRAGWLSRRVSLLLRGSIDKSSKSSTETPARHTESLSEVGASPKG